MKLAAEMGVSNDPMMLAIRAQAALQESNRAKAKRLIDRAFSGINIANTQLPFREAHETAVAVYQAVGDSKAALAHLTALKRLDDEATKLATTTSTALMAARFDFANQELKIAKLRQDELARSVAFEQARARTQRFVFLGAAGATAIVIALLGFGLVTIRRSRNEVRAANDDLAVTNTALGKALAAKTEFLATTSHEIRTPLNGILGMAQVMLADRALDGATRDRLKVVHGAGLTMRALVDDILDVAKMETGNLTIEQAAFDLRAVVIDATRLWEAQAADKGLAFSRDLERCPTMVEGDAARVRQIVFNLLSNALKFTAAGRVTLTVAADEGGDRYRIVVADSGVGIAVDQREEIFESFRQADASTTRQFGGTGLGLSICRNLARAMGGDIAVDSVVDEGSTFTVTLPLVVAAEPASTAASCAEETGARLLIVDRNPIARSMMRTLLAPHVAEVDFADDGDAAIVALNMGGVTGVLVDEAALRAGGDAVEAARAIAATARQAGAASTLLWPASDAAGLAAILTAGFDRVVEKPVAGAALVNALFGTKPAITGEEQLVPEAA